jgi:hypothetical protein
VEGLVPLSARSTPQRVVLVGVVPLVFGIVVGLAADASSVVYWLLNVLAILGAVVAGLEMESPKAGAVRGLIAGVIFGLGVLAGAAIGGDTASGVPALNAGTPVVTGIASALLGALGAALRPSPARA